jgi:hypothetical protein
LDRRLFQLFSDNLPEIRSVHDVWVGSHIKININWLILITKLGCARAHCNDNNKTMYVRASYFNSSFLLHVLEIFSSSVYVLFLHLNNIPRCPAWLFYKLNVQFAEGMQTYACHIKEKMHFCLIQYNIADLLNHNIYPYTMFVYIFIVAGNPVIAVRLRIFAFWPLMI